MWIAREIAARRVTLDFSSSSGGQYEVTQIVVDGVVLANAAQLTDWADERVQAIVCESCGIEHCEPGGWITLRRAGEVAVFIPAFDEMERSEEDRAEYRPPSYFAQNGTPVFSTALYEQLVLLCAGLPVLDGLSSLRGSELVRCMQLEAPRGALGTFPNPPDVREGAVLETTEEDRRVARAFRETLRSVGASDVVRIERARDGAPSPPIHLAARRSVDVWRPIALWATPRLIPSEGHVAITSSETGSR